MHVCNLAEILAIAEKFSVTENSDKVRFYYIHKALKLADSWHDRPIENLNQSNWSILRVYSWFFYMKIYNFICVKATWSEFHRLFYRQRKTLKNTINAKSVSWAKLLDFKVIFKVWMYIRQNVIELFLQYAVLQAYI